MANYISNKELLVLMKEYKKGVEKEGKTFPIGEELGLAIVKIAKNLSNKYNFRGYSYKEDMIQNGIVVVLKYLHNFDPAKSNNPFSYITRILWRSFLQTIKIENTERTKKFALQGIDNAFYESRGLGSVFYSKHTRSKKKEIGK